MCALLTLCDLMEFADKFHGRAYCEPRNNTQLSGTPDSTAGRFGTDLLDKSGY